MANKNDDFGKTLLSGLSSAVGGLPGSLLSGGLNMLFGHDSAKQQFENQKKLMEYQSQLQKGMMQYQWNNQYGAQVQGMKGAGLNPALMQGGSFGLNSAPSVSGGSAAAPQVFPTQLAQNALLASQIKVNESLVNKNNAEAGNTSIDTQIKQLSVPYYQKLYSPEMIHVSMEKFKADLWETNTRTFFYEEDAKRVQASVDNILGLTALNEQERRNAAVEYSEILARIQKTFSDIQVNQSQSKLNNSELLVNSAKYYYLKGLTKYVGEEALTESNKRELMDSQKYLNNAAASNQWSQSVLNDAKIFGQNAANELNQWDVKYMRKFGEKENKIRFFKSYISGFSPVVDNTCKVLDSAKGGYKYRESSSNEGSIFEQGASTFEW